jgi:hypothetical protein
MEHGGMELKTSKTQRMATMPKMPKIENTTKKPQVVSRKEGKDFSFCSLGSSIFCGLGAEKPFWGAGYV